jgi:hypothetical protein
MSNGSSARFHHSVYTSPAMYVSLRDGDRPGREYAKIPKLTAA